MTGLSNYLYILSITLLLFSCKGENGRANYEYEFKNNSRDMISVLGVNGGTEQFLNIKPVQKGDVIDLLNSFDKNHIPIEIEITHDLNAINYKYEVFYDHIFTISGAGVDGVWNTEDDIHHEMNLGTGVEFNYYGTIKRK
tara:strand:+ start:892 stop:1311 length:420 start_codon:yes stop_codon:yes gene_type:complete